MRICFIDLETTGFPRCPGYNEYYHYSEIDKYDSSRIVQIASAIYDFDEKTTTFTEKDFQVYTVKPEDFTIYNSKIHGITNEEAEKNGEPFEEIMKILADHFTNTDLLVAHAVKFDRNVLLSELYRHELKDLVEKIEKIQCFCTCFSCASITKITTNRGYKVPKLTELYKFLFNEEFIGNHNAAADVSALVKCFIHMVENLKLTLTAAGDNFCVNN